MAKPGAVSSHASLFSGCISGAILIFGLAGAPTASAAQSPTGAISGRVTAADSTRAPLRDASVTVSGTQLRAVTDAGGLFHIEGVPAADPLMLRVRLLGYRTVERAVRVAPGETVSLDVRLEQEAMQLLPVFTGAPSIDAEIFRSMPNVGTITLGAVSMEGIPRLGEPDVIRVVQLLPGVVARNDFSTGLNVRGGEADQNLVLLDGHPIYNPFHLGGLFSTFMDATVGGIELMTAAFPARYGGRLSSVLDVRSADESRIGVNGSADISALGASAKMGGISGSGRGMWSVAARRTYADAAAEIFSENSFPYHFRDAHVRASYLLSNGSRVAVTAYSGKDVLDLDFSDFEADSAATRAGDGFWSFDWGNTVIGATISRDLAGATLEQRISTSRFATLLDVGEGAQAQRNEIRDIRVSGSLQSLDLGPAQSLSAGYELALNRVRYASGAAQTGTTDFDILQRPLSAAVWIEDVWRPTAAWIIQPAVRIEALNGEGRDWRAISPRVSLKYFAAPRLALTAGAGRATQWLHSLAGDGPLRYFDIWIASDSFIPVTSAWHYVAGAERLFGRGDAGSLKIEGYYKRYDRVFDANPSDDPQRRGDELFDAVGASYGVDALARWRSGVQSRFSGWVAYSYGVSWRERDGERWAPGHDRRHDVDVVATLRAGRYRLGARVGYATGTPYTHIVGQVARRVYDPSRDDWGTGDPGTVLDPLGAARNGARFPAVHRLDLDASREFHVRGATVSPYVSVVNAYNARNVFVYLYDYSTHVPTRRALSQFPVLPSAGVRIEF